MVKMQRLALIFVVLVFSLAATLSPALAQSSDGMVQVEDIVIEGNRRYVPCIYVLNKIDSITIEELELLNKMKHCVPISAAKEWNLDGLLEKVW